MYQPAKQNAAIFEGLPAYLAVSDDHQTFVELDHNDVTKCKGLEAMICPPRKAVNRKRYRRSCAAALFLRQVERIQSECVRKQQEWKGPEALYVAPRLWAYSAEAAQQVTIHCSEKVSSSRVITLNGTGLLDVPRGCSAHSDEWVFQASFKREATSAENDTRKNWAIRPLPPLTFSVAETAISSSTAAPLFELLEIDRRYRQGLSALRAVEENVRSLQTKDEQRLASKEIRGLHPAGEWLVVTIIILMIIACLPIGWWLARERRYVQHSLNAMDERIRQCSALQTVLTERSDQLEVRLHEHEAAVENATADN